MIKIKTIFRFLDIVFHGPSSLISSDDSLRKIDFKICDEKGMRKEQSICRANQLNNDPSWFWS